jgi:hypothetical protein
MSLLLSAVLTVFFPPSYPLLIRIVLAHFVVTSIDQVLDRTLARHFASIHKKLDLLTERQQRKEKASRP